MRDPARIDTMIDVLRTLWKKSPDMRLGQLIINALGSDPWFLEDDEALVKLEAFSKLLTSR